MLLKLLLLLRLLLLLKLLLLSDQVMLRSIALLSKTAEGGHSYVYYPLLGMGREQYK